MFDPWFWVMVFVGAVLGSFFNVVIVRLPQMLRRSWQRDCEDFLRESFAREAEKRDLGAFPADKMALCFPKEAAPLNLALPASHCVHCGHTLSAQDNIPVLSFLFLRGRCRYCGEKISALYPVVEILAALLAGLAFWRDGLALPQLLVSLGFLWTLLILAAIDWREQLLPDVLTLPLLFGGLLVAALGWSPLTASEAILGACVAYLLLFVVYWLFFWLTKREGLGFGDLKLLAALGAFLGLEALGDVILLAAILGVVAGVWLKFLGKTGAFPFGPALAFSGAVLWLFHGASFWDFWF